MNDEDTTLRALHDHQGDTLSAADVRRVLGLTGRIGLSLPHPDVGAAWSKRLIERYVRGEASDSRGVSYR